MNTNKQIFADYVVTQLVATRIRPLFSNSVTQVFLPRRLLIIETVYAESVESVEILAESTRLATKGILGGLYARLHEERGYTRNSLGVSQQAKARDWHTDVCMATGALIGYIEHAQVHTANNGGSPMVDGVYRSMRGVLHRTTPTQFVLECLAATGQHMPSDWSHEEDWYSESYFLEAETYDEYLHRWKGAARKFLCGRSD